MSALTDAQYESLKAAAADGTLKIRVLGKEEAERITREKVKERLWELYQEGTYEELCEFVLGGENDKT